MGLVMMGRCTASIFYRVVIGIFGVLNYDSYCMLSLEGKCGRCRCFVVMMSSINRLNQDQNQK